MGAAPDAGPKEAADAGRSGPTSPPCVPAPAGLVSWWRGERNLLDAAGPNRATADGVIRYRPGVVGDALHFGAAGKVVAPVDGLPLGGADRTIELWARVDFYPISGTYDAFLFGYGPGAGVAGENFLLGVRAARVLELSAWDSALLAGHTVLELGRPYHLAVTTRGADVAMYVDGRLDASGTAGLRTTPGSVVFGMFTSGAALEGFVDEVSIYDRALDAQEIAAIHAAGAGGKCPVEAPRGRRGTARWAKLRPLPAPPGSPIHPSQAPPQVPEVRAAYDLASDSMIVFRGAPASALHVLHQASGLDATCGASQTPYWEVQRVAGATPQVAAGFSVAAGHLGGGRRETRLLVAGGCADAACTAGPSAEVRAAINPANAPDQPPPSWEALSAMPGGRAGAAVATSTAMGEIRAIVHGGVDRDDTVVLGGGRWAPEARAPSPGVRAFGALIHRAQDDVALLLGGRDASGRVSDEVWRLDGASQPADARWTRIAVDGSPPPREVQVAAYASACDAMVVLGGDGGLWLLVEPFGARPRGWSRGDPVPDRVSEGHPQAPPLALGYVARCDRLVLLSSDGALWTVEDPCSLVR